MPIKINEKILSIPPYLSTSWSHIAALHMKGSLFVVTLADGDTINIPGLDTKTIELIFSYHAAYLEKEQLSTTSSSLLVKENKEANMFSADQSNESIRLVLGSLDGLGTAMQHNPAQSNAPDLPADLLQKISSIANLIIPLDETFDLKFEPFCNCFHCQIAKALNSPATTVEASTQEAEVIKDEELQFQQWNITQTGDKLFSVTNRLDSHEKYNVYLGQPVGCTCGKQGCEHILAVLKS